MDILEELKKTRLMVLARGVSKDVLLKAVAAIEEAGVTVFESTFDHRRADCIAENAEKIAALVAAYGERMAIGAGTVLTVEEVRAAHAAGATFIVSPGFNPKVTEYVLKKGMPMTPGVCTPTEIEAALQFGLDVLKFFPAEPAGGLKMIKALAAPYVGVNFMPTGGISAANVRDYLAYDRIVACGGSWMVSGKLVKEGKFDEIEKLVREAAGIVKEIRG